MRAIIISIEAEYRRYKALGDAAMAQLAEGEWNEQGPRGGNSIAVVVWHVAGNLRSRFTDFLVTDGEKLWRNREKEFAEEPRTRQELSEYWDRGWQVLFGALSQLTDAHLQQTILIRGIELKVHEALHRSLAHTSYHVGQIVYIAKGWRGSEWQYLSIPPGGSENYNQNPISERAAAHTSRLNSSIEGAG